jgi:uncharacterized protein (TIGR01777 family)
MNILIAGASGFVGRVLANHLSKNHSITVLGRSLVKLESVFSKDIKKLTWGNLASQDAKHFDLIISLSGSNIGDKRWSAKVKKELIESRTQTNEQLVDWLIHHQANPRFFCANAIGIYGAQELSTEVFDENSALASSSDDFLQHIALLWERSLKKAIDAGIPVTILRFGVVLKKGEGMLKKLELPFSLGLGSVLGSGNQALSWIYYKDLIKAVDFLIAHQEVTGPVNITTPYPLTQQEFSKLFAKALKRPLFLKTPKLMIQIMFGEMGEYLLLKGQRVFPKRLSELGFHFSYPKMESALNDAFDKETTNKET